jgi:parallel beta-helix repeat protein
MKQLLGATAAARESIPRRILGTTLAVEAGSRHARRVTRSVIAAQLLVLGVSVALLPGIGSAAGRGGCTVQVHAGQSIQAAIDSASPGATVCVGPGTYHENLLIAKDGITLKGAGAGATVLKPPARPLNVCEKLVITPVDTEPTGLNGICVGKLDAKGNILGTVSNVRVTGFAVRGFKGVGIVFVGANRPRADHDAAAHNGEYGITAFASTHGLFEHDTSNGSGDAGIYMGDSPNGRFTIRDNTVSNALWGILVRDSSRATLTGNTLHDNCAGLVFFNTGAPVGPRGAFRGVGNVLGTGNTVTHNDNYCPGKASDLPFTLTGVGILIFGGNHIVLTRNAGRANRPKPGGTPTTIGGVVLAGGIVVASTQKVSLFGPPHYGSAATGNTVMHNTAMHNQPNDLAYDGQGTGNVFRTNTCVTSHPAGLCR